MHIPISAIEKISILLRQNQPSKPYKARLLQENKAALSLTVILEEYIDCFKFSKIKELDLDQVSIFLNFADLKIIEREIKDCIRLEDELSILTGYSLSEINKAYEEIKSILNFKKSSSS